MSPAASIRFHLKHSGLASTVKAAAKLYARRFACRHVVSMNVTVSDWVKMRQPFKRQMRIHNPFPLERFRNGEIAREPEYDFVYLGRLVSEKGVATLIRGFDLLSKRTRKLHRMLVIGDGNWRNRLESLTRELRIEDRIEFAGRKTGEELSRLVHQCRAAVVPSDWEEPMGGVAVELLAAGLPVIVSKNGGLAECVGDAGLVFENGDHQSLAEKMQRILEDRELLARLAANRESQLKLFDPPMLARQYLDLFESLLGIEPDRAIAVSEADRAFPSH
jgi:glycosyltransferase involved in cell wall biosynthesis